MNLTKGLFMAAWLIFAGKQTTLTQERAAQETTAKKDDAKGAAVPAPRATENDGEYKIGPQDVLRIDVWKEGEISRSVPVRPDGKISLPLLNDVQAAGLTAVQLAGVITDGLKKFITSPQVTVSVTEINSRRVYVTGEVARAGALSLLPNMTVLQALSSCGGFTQFANTKKIYILRTEDGKQVKISVNYKELVSGRKAEENISLRPGDTVVVP
jgi:polysaccharide export outer membrane protein